MSPEGVPNPLAYHELLNCYESAMVAVVDPYVDLTERNLAVQEAQVYATLIAALISSGGAS